MAKYTRYQSYDDYIREQIRANERKINKIGVHDENLHVAALYFKYYCSEIKQGLCHGVRNGYEVQYFRKALNVPVIGTDISPTASQYPHCVTHDFHDLKEEWTGAFSFVYSNALDHAHDPNKAVSTWLQQLHKGGILCLEHGAHSERISISDCYGATFKEWRELLRPFEADTLVEAVRLPIKRRAWFAKRMS